MKLQSSYSSMSDVPTGYESAYEEKEGKAVFVGGEFEFATESELTEVKKAKQKGFEQYHDLKKQMKALEGVDPEKYKSMMEEMDVLRAQLKNGGVDESAIKEIVDARVARATEELLNTNKDLSSKLSELENFKLETEKSGLLSKLLGEHISSTALPDAEFIIGSAIERQADGTYVSNGKAGFEKGLPVDKLVVKAVESRPHWKKQSISGHGGEGSSGGGGIGKNQRVKILIEKQKNGEISRAEKVELNTLVSSTEQ